MSDFTVIKRDAYGKEQLRYPGLVVARGPGWVCIDAVFSMPSRDLGYIKLRRGDRFREWFYAERWYNIFRVADADSHAIKGWYCNITRPALITAGQAAADDLALDVFVYADGRSLLLDQAEFEALDLPERECQQAWQAVSQIRALVKERQPPFDEIR